MCPYSWDPPPRRTSGPGTLDQAPLRVPRPLEIRYQLLTANVLGERGEMGPCLSLSSEGPSSQRWS